MAAVGALADDDGEASEEERCRKVAQGNSEALGLLLGAAILAGQALSRRRENKMQEDDAAQMKIDTTNLETELEDPSEPEPPEQDGLSLEL